MGANGKHFTRKTKNRGKSEGEKALIKRKKMDFDYLAPTQQLDSSDTEELDESTSSSKIYGIVKVSGENIQEESFEIRSGENVIGRDRSQCQIVLQCQSLSRIHAIISAEEDGCTVMDKGSSNVTVKGTLKLKPNVMYHLDDNEEIK